MGRDRFRVIGGNRLARDFLSQQRGFQPSGSCRCGEDQDMVITGQTGQQPCRQGLAGKGLGLEVRPQAMAEQGLCRCWSDCRDPAMGQRTDIPSGLAQRFHEGLNAGLAGQNQPAEGLQAADSGLDLFGGSPGVDPDQVKLDRLATEFQDP